MTILDINDSLELAAPSVGAGVVVMQKTLMDSVRLSGIGLHSGGETRVILHPAPENTGIMFSSGSSKIAGLASNVVDTARGTTIGANGTRIQTIEHLMAALRGRGVDNAIVEVSGPEMPAMDGSAKLFVEAIDAVGVASLDAQRKPIVLKEPIWIKRNDAFILAVPAPQLRITYVMNYNHPMIGAQTATYVLEESNFAQQIAPARTFAIYEEVAGLLEKHLAQGGSLDNALVIWQDHLSADLRFPDELARHKIVDLVGDLSLVGGLLQADVLAVKSGHALNVEFAHEVEKRVTSYKL